MPGTAALEYISASGRRAENMAEDIPATMRAAMIAGPGEPFHLAELPLPVRINAEVLVRIVAAGINPIDIKTRAGAGVTAAISSYPAVLGHDFSGVVVQSPYEAHPLRPGDEVYGMATVPRVGGSFAEYASIPSLNLTRKPKHLSHLEAAGVPLAALTAWEMVVDVAKVHEGQRVLIHAGAGGVGHFAVQFAAYFGSYVIATGSAGNLDWMRELGAAEVIDYSTTRFEDVIGGIDVVIDLIGNVHDSTGTRSLRVLRPDGLIINAPTGSWPEFSAEATAAGVRGSGFKVAADGSTLAAISRLLDSGEIRVHLDEVFPLERIAEAEMKLRAGHTRGKIVLSVSGA